MAEQRVFSRVPMSRPHTCGIIDCQIEQYFGAHDASDPQVEAGLVVGLRSCGRIEAIYNYVAFPEP